MVKEKSPAQREALGQRTGWALEKRIEQVGTLLSSGIY